VSSEKYNFIVAGGGAAGLSLLVHMIHCGKFNDRKILLAERAPKTENDRTWCFWESTPGHFESIVHKTWEKLWFYPLTGKPALHTISPYRYKMIRGIDFYNHCYSIISQCKNISVEYGTVERVSPDGTSLIMNGREIHADYIFNSLPPKFSAKKNSEYFLWQHFKGWFIHSDKKVFTADEAILMDFRVDQKNDTRFVYVMPFNSHDALIEYTVFSESKLENAEYDNALAEYCKSRFSMKQGDYSIMDQEFGMIPMTNIILPSQKGRMINIGGAGGQTKASSGYTFKNIQKQSEQIVSSLINTGSPFSIRRPKKFDFYDSIFLKILSDGTVPGVKVFSKLFGSNKMSEVFKFLDDETSIIEDLRLISKLPRKKFMKAAFSHLLGQNSVQKKNLQN
jgi:lycopene beta-cyclase